MTNNDTSTLNGALQELGETIADNLVSMGVVDADASDGLTTLAGKILSIEPSIGGLDLDTAITLTSSSASITFGGSVVLTSKLTASYDDETLVNVDLEGVLTGATVSFMNGNTVIGTDVTDSNGVATYTYTPAVNGTLSLKSVFAGTDNFDDCESSAVTVSVIAVPDSVTLSADKSVLSYYDGESATLSATVLDANSRPCSGETVEFFNGSTSMGTATTNDSGVATKSYSSAGVGDVTFTAEVGNLVSEIFVVEDCFFNGLNTDAFTIPANTTFSNDGDMITATTTTSGEKLVYLDHTLSNTDNWEFEIEIAQLGVSQSIAPFWNDNSFWGGQTNGNFNQVYSNMNGESTLSETVTIDKLFKITRQDGVTTVSYNDKTVQSKTVSHKSSFRVGFYINRSRTQYYKNIKLKPL